MIASPSYPEVVAISSCKTLFKHKHDPQEACNVDVLCEIVAPERDGRGDYERRASVDRDRRERVVRILLYSFFISPKMILSVKYSRTQNEV